MAKEPDYTRPPKFHPDVDFQDWRKKIGEWVATIKKAHDQGQDRALQTRFTLLGRIFYSEALPDAHKSLVDDGIAKKKIDLFNDNDPVETVLSIVNVVAVDAPISQVTRLIATYQNVISCTRKKDERLSLFASRFRGLAGKHLRYCGASPSSQTGQVLAITLLNNARLDEIVFTNAKMQLISLAQDRAKAEADEKTVHLVDYALIEPIVEAAEGHSDVCSAELPKDKESRSSFLTEARKGSADVLRQLHEIPKAGEMPQDESDSIEEKFKEKGQIIKLHLDDAVTVLRNIAQEPQSKPVYTMEQVNSMVDDRLRAFLSNHGNALAHAPPLSSKPMNSGINKKRNQKGKAGGRSSKKDSANNKGGGSDRRRNRLDALIPNAHDHCLDCGSKYHKRGSPECKTPSWGTRKIREKNDRDNNNGRNQGFRGGSNQ